MAYDDDLPDIYGHTMQQPRYMMTCPFRRTDTEGTVYNEGYPHPKGFLHSEENCIGGVDLAEYLTWLGQQVSIKYTNPGKEPV